MAPAWVQQRTMSPRDPPLPSREGERVWDGIDTTAADDRRAYRPASVPARELAFPSIADGSEHVLTRSPDCSVSSLAGMSRTAADALALARRRH
jgi:hypothetical protein